MSGGDGGSEDTRPLSTLHDNSGKHGLPPAEPSPSQGAWVGDHCTRRVFPWEMPHPQTGGSFPRVWVPDRNKPLTGTVTCLGHFMSPDPGGLGLGEDWGQKGRCRSMDLGPLTSLGLSLLLCRANVIRAPALGGRYGVSGDDVSLGLRSGGRGQAP